MAALGRILILGSLLAAAAGALLGFERELSDKPAGIRTYALVSQGAAPADKNFSPPGPAAESEKD